jgi:hypothetical protein
MYHFPQRANDPPAQAPSLLMRAGVLALLPVLLLLALPVLLLFVLVLYTLALAQGVRIFVFRWDQDDEAREHGAQKPHFLEIEVPAQVVSDETTSRTQE